MKKFVKLLMALVVIVPCMIAMVACDTVSAAERPPVIDGNPDAGYTQPEVPDDVEDPEVDEPAQDPEVDIYQAVDSQATLEALLKATAKGEHLYVRLVDNITVQHTIVIDRYVTLDLNGKTIVNNKQIWQKNSAKDWSLLSVRTDDGHLIIEGNGKLQTCKDDCYAVDVQSEHARLEIYGGTYIGNIHAVYVKEGRCTIYGGYFKIQQLFPVKYVDPQNPTEEELAKAYGFVLNCLDANYQLDADNNQIGKARIWVYGGQFENFNPAACGAESASYKGTNYVVMGYHAELVKQTDTKNIYQVVE